MLLFSSFKLLNWFKKEKESKNGFSFIVIFFLYKFFCSEKIKHEIYLFWCDVPPFCHCGVCNFSQLIWSNVPPFFMVNLSHVTVLFKICFWSIKMNVKTLKWIDQCLCSVLQIWKGRVQMQEPLSFWVWLLTFAFAFNSPGKLGLTITSFLRDYWNLHLHECWLKGFSQCWPRK